MDFTPSDLIIGYLNKSLDKDGMDEFYKWILHDPENKKIFFEAKTIFDACSPNHPINLEKSWQRLLEKKYTDNNSRLQTNIWYYMRRYAAVAIIAATVTSTLFIFHKDDLQPAAQYISEDGLQADAIILPDGTRVNIGNKTKFRCSPDYNKKDRVVYLEGEAMFEVAKHLDKPFIVKVNGQNIEALGTKFNVMAYSSDSIYSTTLLEGSIRLATQDISDITTLRPNQQFTYNRNSRTANVKEVEASLYTSWVDGYYYFPDQTFQSILSRLSNIYGVKFEIETEKLKHKRFTGTFYRGQSIKDILEIISITIPIKYKIEENLVVIK